MANKQRETVLCQICREDKKLNRVVPAELVREPLVEMIRKTHPGWSSDGFICLADLNRFRTQFVKDVLERDKGELTVLDQQVVASLKEHELLSKNVNIEFDRQLTLGERMSDRLADFGGSWVFILGFAAVIVVWISINSFALLHRTFDPYPFILLNLVLSCLAAVQAPIIMMSQNRQEAKDRLRAEHDYRVNLKAELEIRHLHEKIDHLLMNQWQRLLEIQEIQTELMEELTRKSPRGRGD